MTDLLVGPPALELQTAASRLATLGFLSCCDLPDRPGPAFLLVALRDTPTLHHFDPEAVDYWVSVEGRGSRRRLTRDSVLPVDTEFAWGTIRLVDRLHVTNEYLTFGGRLTADRVDGSTIAVFTSPAPILRRGGHSQGWDPGGETLGAFFGRLLVAVDYRPGFEARVASVDPITRYAAFVADAMARYRSSPTVRAQQQDLWTMLQGEARRLRDRHPEAWRAGESLLQGAGLSP